MGTTPPSLCSGPVCRGQTSPVWHIRRWPASLNVRGQQPSLAQTSRSGAVSRRRCFFLPSRFSRGVLQEGPFSCLRAFLGTAAGALTCCCRHPFPSTVSFDAPDSVRGPLEEDPLRPVARCAPMCPAQSDIQLGVPLSSSSETHPGGCWRVAGRTEEGTCPLRRALCVCVALTAAAAAAHTGAAPPAGPSIPCSGPGGPCGAGSELPARAVGPRWHAAFEERWLGRRPGRAWAHARPPESVLSSGPRRGPSVRGSRVPLTAARSCF